MGLVAQCDCGKRMGVADALAGRYIRCSSCGNEVYVAPRAAQPPGSKPAKVKGNASSPSVAVSPTLVTAGIILGVLAILWGIFYFGPWRVGNQWAAMSSRANDEVTDVVEFALQAYENQHSGISSKYVHNTPQLSGPASFVPPMMAFSMPQKIIFIGKTNRGNYSGTYNTTSHEVEATIEVGGMSVGGLVDVRKASGSFRITGREKDGKTSAERDGKPMELYGPHVED